MRNLPKRKDIKTESPIEDIMLRELNIMNLYPVIQFKVGNYRLDLAFPEHKVGIECDGRDYHSSDEQIARDAERDKWLKEQGWDIIRVSGSDIYRHADEIVKLLAGKQDRIRDNSWKRRSPIIELPDENDEVIIQEDLKEDIEEEAELASNDREEWLDEEFSKREWSPLKETIKSRFSNFGKI